MKRTIGIITGLLALLSSFFASAHPAGNGDTSLLWQISGKGLAKPSYLFGTIHQVCPTDYIWTGAMQRTLDKSEKLCLEIDLDVNKEDLMAKNLDMLLDMKKPLSEYFTAEQYRKLERYAQDSLGIDKMAIAYMRPVTILMMMTKEAGSLCESPVSYEEKIMSTAKKANKKVLGLETVAEQLNALGAIPNDSVVKYVMESMEDKGVEDGMEEYKKLVAAYKQQDIATLQTMIASDEGLGTSTGALVDDRNKKWIDRMAGMMQGTSVFFAVGAGHLAGPNGVISLLRKTGYTVVAVK